MNAESVSSNDGAFANASTVAIASSWVRRSPWAKDWTKKSLRAVVVDNAGAASAPIAPMSTRSMRSDAWQNWRSRRLQNPIGASPVAEATTPREASSRAMPPPVELPATCGRPRPCSPIHSSTASVSPAMSARGAGADAPKPGRSTAHTS